MKFKILFTILALGASSCDIGRPIVVDIPQDNSFRELDDLCKHVDRTYEVVVTNGNARGRFHCERVSNTVAENCIGTSNGIQRDVVVFGGSLVMMSKRKEAPSCPK